MEAPHVGHLYSMVIADVLKRWRVLLGQNDAQLLTGTDEHGMKVWRLIGVGKIRSLTVRNRSNKLLRQLEWILRPFATGITRHSRSVALKLLFLDNYDALTLQYIGISKSRQY